MGLSYEQRQRIRAARDARRREELTAGGRKLGNAAEREPGPGRREQAALARHPYCQEHQAEERAEVAGLLGPSA